MRSGIEPMYLIPLRLEVRLGWLSTSIWAPSVIEEYLNQLDHEVHPSLTKISLKNFEMISSYDIRTIES